MAELKIIYRNPADLIPYVNNAKTHGAKQIDAIAASIKEFGFNAPILTDGDSGLVAGHGRREAAIKLGLKQVPTVDLSHLSEAQKKAYILADNRLGEIDTSWDMELVNIELDALADMDFDIELTGFDFDGADIQEDLSEDYGGIDYQENYAVVVTCADSADQEKIYNKLLGMGYDCKVLVN